MTERERLLMLGLCIALSVPLAVLALAVRVGTAVWRWS